MQYQFICVNVFFCFLDNCQLNYINFKFCVQVAIKQIHATTKLFCLLH